MTAEFTDDPWHDHGIGYLRFAMAKRHLFSGVISGESPLKEARVLKSFV